MDPSDRLNPLDVWFLHLEDDADMMHIGALLVFEGPPPPFDEIRNRYQARIAEVRRYRQVVRGVPLWLNRPVWVDDPHFDLDYHLRHTALPPPGGGAELRNLVGRVMGQRLDRHRPLWETWVVEGLEEGHWAVITKVHHCMVDGIAGTELTEAFLDRDPSVTAEPATELPAPDDPPGRAELVRDAVRDHAQTVGGLIGSAVRALRRPADAARQAAAIGSGMVTMAGLGRPVPVSTLTGPITPHRRWDWASADLAEVKAIKDRLGGTVNDVVLTAVTRGFHDLLITRGERDAEVRSLIPVSTRPADAHNHDNRVAALFATLPVEVDGPLTRYRAVQEEMESLKTSGEALFSAALVQSSGLAPSLLLGPAMHLSTEIVNHVGQRNANTVVTNVPGPQHTLYLAGRRLLQWFPYVPIAEAARIGVAVLSYDGNLRFGVTGDFDHSEDLAVLTAGIEDGIAELSKLAGRTAAADP